MTTLRGVELGVLGPLQVRQHGVPVAIPGAKPRAILAMLGLHGGSLVPADTLVELLWGEDPPRTAAKALQTHISALRRTLGDGFVLTEGAGWTLAETDVDAARYKSAARLARDAAAAGDTGQAVARFEEALALWRGAPELPDGRRGTSEKTRWIEGHAALVEDRADALLATGRAAEIIGELEAAVAEAPLRERRWGQLMLALYRAGRQGEALGAYQRARAQLAEELGVDPGPELRRLEAAIVAQDSSLDVLAAQQLPSVTRAVTFLLTDIEGSTAAWEADADAMAVALARHDELVEEVVTSRGGRLIKTRGEGDATFSVFERPSAAAAAAIELQDAIGHEPWELREPMRIRVALHTGEVELRDGDYFGRAVNRAARLRSLAEGGQILCSGATAELVIDSLADDVVLADLGMRQLKNLPRPEHVFELRLETGDDAPQPDVAEAPMQRPGLPTVLVGPGPFVGRGHELEGLLSAWQTALVGGMQAVLIAGEPGVGKTRLAGEWSRQAYEQGAVVLYGRCDEDLGAPYQPFAEALRSLVPCAGPDRLRGLRGVEALLALVPGLTDVLPDVAAPTRADPDTERYALFDAVVALLGVASASAPVVLILDDLHWAAKPTLLLLRHLLRFGEQARVQIIGTYRSTDLDRSHPLAAMLADLHRDGTATRLHLGGLDENDVTAYVAEAGYNDEDLARALASVTGGNPFFLIEALRHVDESGGRWDPSTLPQGVREAVSRRLSRLAAETNKALAAAAVVGSRFALELVERVVDQDLVDAFDEACKAGIVIEESGGHYRFNHALVRQSLLAELPSVRRMRLHQRIAATLETQPGADDELLAELAYHYFECAWAGNAAKAVEYCRRAADQAMARLAYEGAADLYDRALHALEEIDDELPDRDDQIAELLIARCEALLAAGDVTSAAGAVAQLQEATVDSARLAAWATCFDGQLSMLIHPERLDDIEAAVGAAADKLAHIADAAGEAQAHTVRAGCLARLGRIGDCEIALDDALTAARRAGEHRRVNNVLANAPLAALWGPNPVPRAGGRCLDVVRLLRITTDSPAVEATSTRCQAVLEAFRGRAAAARRMIDSARRMVTELGLRHALLEVEQFAGIVELVADDPAAAEPHLRKAYSGFRRMGLDADTAETAALLGRACLALDRDTEADELCLESERLAGHALKASIEWRTLRAQLLSRGGDHKEARRVAEAAVALAERTDALVDHGDACATLAMVLGAAGDAATARAAAERAADLYERKGAAALAERARQVLGERVSPPEPGPLETPSIELTNACVHAIRRLEAAFDREAWQEVEQLYAPDVFVESRRKVVGFNPVNLPASEWAREAERYHAMFAVRHSNVVVAVRGERLALTRLEIGTSDVSPGSPQEEVLQLFGLDTEDRIALRMSFDIEDIDAALAELDATHARFEELQLRALETPTVEPDNACVRTVRALDAAYDREAWDEIEQHVAAIVSCDSRRKVVGGSLGDIPYSEWESEARRFREILGPVRYRHIVIAVRGERLALTRLEVGTADVAPGAPRDELLQLYGVDREGRLCLLVWFDVEDVEDAIAELDATHARFERLHDRPPLANAASRVYKRLHAHFAARNWDAITKLLTDDYYGDDRRSVVGAGIRLGPGAAIEDYRSAADIEVTEAWSDVIAVRGARLALTRSHYARSGQEPDGFRVDFLQIVDIDTEERIAALVAFDLDDFDAAIAELDARYLAGEAAAHAHTWSMIAESYAAFSRQESPAISPDSVFVDHRRAAAFGTTDLTTYIRAGWDLGQHIRPYIKAVHRLSDLGAVCSYAAQGVSEQGFDAEWQGVSFATVEGDLINRCEFFDEADLETALASFDQLSRPAPRLENAASRLYERFKVCYATHDWNAITEMLADSVTTEDRRRVVNSGLRQGPDAVIVELSGLADVVKTITSEIIATRGTRLVLSRARTETHEAFHTDFLDVVEVDTSGRAVARVTFDPDDFDAAIAELDARYLAGEAAPYSHSWSLILGGYAALNRHELPPTAPELVSTDHRRGAAFAPGELLEYLRAGWDLDQDVKPYIESVHRLTDLGAVVTHTAHGTSHDGFDAEWREATLFTIDGDTFDRAELFDEADIDAAIARFDQLSTPTPRLENAATRAEERGLACFAARDWDGFAAILADDFYSDDRRPVVNVGIRHGRDVALTNMQTSAELGIAFATSCPIATRGDRLVLSRYRWSWSDRGSDAFHTDVLSIVELGADERIAARVWFDGDDIDAAFEELDRRYLAGEAAAHAHTWYVVAQGYEAFNRRESLPMTPDWVNVDHRRGGAFAPGDITGAIHTAWDLMPNAHCYVEAVHWLTNLGAVVTSATRGTTQEGFDAEWRQIDILTVEGDLVSRCEIFDEADLDAAIVRFDELHPPARRLDNAANQVSERFLAHFANHEWDAMAELLADDYYLDDHRSVVNAGIRHGRDAAIANMRAVADLEIANVAVTAIAARGERLILTRSIFSFGDQGPEAFVAEQLDVGEINSDGRVVANVSFDGDDIDAAFEELDRRYLAGEAAAHAHTWSIVSGSYAAMNRNELFATTHDWVNADRRRHAILEDGGLNASLRSLWELVPDIKFRVEAVHRLTELGAVTTHVAQGVSQHGFHAEWRGVEVHTIDGDLINRCEIFDEADLDAALAHFDDLHRQSGRWENAASRVDARCLGYFMARDTTAVAEILADDYYGDDRRRVVNVGLRQGRDAAIDQVQATVDLGVRITTTDVVAARGERLALSRIRWSDPVEGRDPFVTDVLNIVEVNGDARIVARIWFDPSDIDAAFKELDARYLAGEAATHAHTWSVVAQAYAAVNRRELPALTPDCVSIDHRRGTAFASGDLTAALRASFDLTPHLSIRIKAVHRLSDFGAVVTHESHATSKEGLDAEWQDVNLLTIQGDLLSRCELFDESDIDSALARFDELLPQARRLENAASRMLDRHYAYFRSRDWTAIGEILTDDTFVDDRRRLTSSGYWDGRDVVVANLRALADAAPAEWAIIATRGERLALTRICSPNRDLGQGEFSSDMLILAEIDTDERIAAQLAFDLDDIASAFEELDARYLAGEAATHAQTWSVVAASYAALNRHELPATTPEWVTVDHRRETAFQPGDVIAYIRAGWDVDQDITIYVEVVHRLNDSGAVITYAAHETSREGFHAEWRGIAVFTVEGDMITRTEVFDEAHLDAALTRFEELRPQAPRLKSVVAERFVAHFAARDWDAMAQDFAEDYYCDDRRRVVNAGVRQGRDAAIEDLWVGIDIGLHPNVTSEIIAARGKRLILNRWRASGPDHEAIQVDLLLVVQYDADERITAAVVFDLDDIDAAFEELDRRYLAGEAAARAHTWSVVTRGYSALNGREILPTTPGWVNIDHRHGMSFAPGQLPALLTSWNRAPNVKSHVEVVHRLNNFGAVVTSVSHETSQDGVNAEWRVISIITVEGDLLGRLEVFDEADLDVALSHFDELHAQARRLENAASRAADRFLAHFAAGDWDAMRELLADNLTNEDRRPVVGAGVRYGREAQIADMRATADVWSTHITATVVATRGQRLALMRHGFRNRDQGPEAFLTEILGLLEIDAEGRAVALVSFDANDFDAAIEELDARYLAGEAAAHSHAWSVIARAQAGFIRHELPATTPDPVFIDHRPLVTSDEVDMAPYLRAVWDLIPDVSVYIEAVHRLSELGAVVTQTLKGTSREGFDAEWRMINVFTVEGDLISRCETFDEASLDTALARFEELHPRTPRLENAATRTYERLWKHFKARDWATLAETLADDIVDEDRRRVVNAGIRRGRDAEMENLRAIAGLAVTNVTATVVATRGERLALNRVRLTHLDQQPGAFNSEVFRIIGTDANERIVLAVIFDLDDLDAAFEELDARYLAGEAAAHAHTWSVISQECATFNRHELPAARWVTVDHRQLITIDESDLLANLRTTWDLMPDISLRIEAVHRLSSFGAVVTDTAHGTTPEGFDAEWRMIQLLTVEGDRINRCELFDEEGLDTALARFEELLSTD